jgi:hypothetical protein
MGVQTSPGARKTEVRPSRVRALLEDAEDWCQGKSPWWRLPILAWLGWTGLRLWRDPEAWSILGGITFGIHELGHLVTGAFGTFVSVASGSLFQLAAPAAAVLLLARQRDYFGVAFATGWLGYSMVNLSLYVGDARAKALPLLGFTDDPIHDWNYLLGKLGLLGWDKALAGSLRLASIATFLFAIVFGAWLLWRMAASSPRRFRPAGGPAASP